MTNCILLSQDISVGNCFDAIPVIEELVMRGHISGHDPNCQEMYHMAQFELFDIVEIECEENAIVFYSSHFPAIAVPINFLMEVENVH
jgi:hypothetical protein